MGSEAMPRYVPRKLGRHVGMAHRDALDVGLVDDRVLPRHLRQPVVPPLEPVLDDGAERGERRAVARVEAEVLVRVADLVAEEAVVPPDGAADALGVGVEEDLVRVEAEAFLGAVRAVDAVAVELAGPDAAEVAVPHRPRPLAELDDGARRLVLRAVEEHELDALGALAVEREVDAEAVPRRAERERLAGEDAGAAVEGDGGGAGSLRHSFAGNHGSRVGRGRKAGVGPAMRCRTRPSGRSVRS